MNPITSDLAQAHITEMRRQACSFSTGCVQRVREVRRRRRTERKRAFPAHWVPLSAGFIYHS